ncbi:MAG: hypothetical protein Kow0049_34470 [Stanieria sp.]
MIVAATDITPTEAKNLERGRSLTRIQSAQLAKYHLIRKYSVNEVTPELVEADSKKLYPALRLRFWLTVGREYLADCERERFEQQKQRNHGNFFIPDLNHQTSITRIKLLEMPQLNLRRFTNPKTEWSNKSPELIELKEFVIKDLVRFNQILGCGIAATDSPITIIQKIFKVVGLKLPCLRNERDGKKRLRIYGAAQSKFRQQDIESEILISNH